MAWWLDLLAGLGVVMLCENALTAFTALRARWTASKQPNRAAGGE